MAYLIFTANGEEFDRRELEGPVVLGRAPDCDFSLPDITLSRHHCRIEPVDDAPGWRIIDLQSKNGTFFLGRPTQTHTMRENDEIRIGRTRLTFKEGAFIRGGTPARPRAVMRPTDPHEALAGTVTGMVLCEPDEVERSDGMPIPQPRPTDPTSFVDDNIYGMINEIASSSWDSIMAQNSKPVRMQRAAPVPAVTKAHRGTIRPKPRVSFCLQAQTLEKSSEGASTSTPRPPSIMTARRPRKRRFVMAAASVLATVSFIIAWMAVLLHASNPEALPISPPQQTLDLPMENNPSPRPVVDLTEPQLSTSAVMASDSQAIERGNSINSTILPPFARTPGLLQAFDSQADAMLPHGTAY